MGVPHQSSGNEVNLPGLILLLRLAVPSAGAEPWIEVKAPHVTVLTNGGEKAGRRTALQFEQFDRALQKRFPWIKLDDGGRLTVIASPEERIVRSFAPDSSEEADRSLSSYFALSSQAVAVVRTDLPEPADKERNPNREAYRGHAAFLIDKSLGTAPPWLSKGLSTFLGDAVVKEKEILAGRVTLIDASSSPPPAPAEFFKENRIADRRFETQAGLFVHYLLAGEGGKNPALLDTFVQRLASGAPPAQIQETLARITFRYAGFPKHLASKKFATVKFPLDATLDSSSFAVRPLGLAEAAMLRAEIMFELNRPVDVRGLLREAKATDSTLARPYEIEAILFEREQRTAESRQAIQAAIELGSKNPALHYRLAQLLWAPTMAKPALQAAVKTLEIARDQAPSDPNILAYLADVQSDLALTEPALKNAERAALLLPKDPYVSLVLARAQWNAKKVDAAQVTARAAMGLTKSPSQKQLAQQLLDFATKNRKAQTTGAKPYRSQVGPPPSGAFGATRSAADTAGTGANPASLGAARAGSADASAIADCFARRDNAACARAVPSLEAACAEKQSTSCVSLGSLYDGGFGVGRDRRKAAPAYKTACELEDKAGCARLAVLEAQGLGVPRNAPKATKTLEGLCSESIPDACIGLAQLLRQTGGPGDQTRARALLKTACDQGASEACALISAR